MPKYREPPELPEVAFLTVCKHKGEWACIKLIMQGDRIVDREVLGGGATHQHAWNAFKVNAQDLFFTHAW